MKQTRVKSRLALNLDRTMRVDC